MDGSDAEYYQAHKEDDEEWGSPERTPSRARRRLAAMVSVRFSPEEVALVRQAATERHQSLSSFVRQAALERCRVEPPTAHITGQAVGVTAIGASRTETRGGPEMSPVVRGVFHVGDVWIDHAAS